MNFTSTVLYCYSSHFVCYMQTIDFVWILHYMIMNFIFLQLLACCDNANTTICSRLISYYIQDFLLIRKHSPQKLLGMHYTHFDVYKYILYTFFILSINTHAIKGLNTFYCMCIYINKIKISMSSSFIP